MGSRYDPEQVRRFFDDYGEREWERLEATLADRVSFHLHRRMLARHIGPGDRVLEVGAGPGRFTIELARLGARIAVTDLSGRQLELNQAKTGAAGVQEQIEGWLLCDAVDLAPFPSGAFDAAVAFGGPLSYVFDQRDRALGELVRVTRPGGVILLSVMSLLGATRLYLPAVVEAARLYGLGPAGHVIRTGELHDPRLGDHFCHMYRWRELEAFLRRHPLEILQACAANFVTVQNESVAAEAAADPQLARWLLEVEEAFCEEPGALDGGTHILVAARRLTG